MTPLLAAYADQVIIEAFWRFVPIAIAALAFGAVYYVFRRRRSKREDAERKAWIEGRRAERATKRDGVSPN